jgi:hypothetical protein
LQVNLGLRLRVAGNAFGASDDLPKQHEGAEDGADYIEEDFHRVYFKKSDVFSR